MNATIHTSVASRTTAQIATRWSFDTTSPVLTQANSTIVHQRLTQRTRVAYRTVALKAHTVQNLLTRAAVLARIALTLVDSNLAALASKT